MKPHIIVISSFICATLLFLAASACKKTPLEPPPAADEPDTARSVVSAIINGEPWEIRTPDTLSKGSVTSQGVMVRGKALFVQSWIVDMIPRT